MNFERWIKTMITEKGIDMEEIIEVEGASGLNVIPVGVLVDHMIIAVPEHQAQIKKMLIKIDFANGDIMHFLKYMAGAIAC